MSLAFERAFRRSIHADQSNISSFHDHSDESAAEYTVQAGLGIGL